MSQFISLNHKPTPTPASRVLAAFLSIFMASAIFATAQTPNVRAPLLSPQPKELHTIDFIPIHSVTVLIPGGDAEDLFAAQNLDKALAQRGILVAPAIGPADLTVTLLREPSDQAQQLLSENKLSFDPSMQAEGYILLSQRGPDGHAAVAIIAQTSAGIFYGAQTLKQLVVTDNGVNSLWTATIRDWPSMKYRGLHDDLSRGPNSKSLHPARSTFTLPTSSTPFNTRPTR
jgi:hexosaminidase